MYPNPFINQFPYMDSHEMNLDWIIRTCKLLENKVDTYTILNSISYQGEWLITKQYTKWSVVFYNGIAYLSLQPVPGNVPIDNTDYWLVIAPYAPEDHFDSDSINPVQNKTVTAKFEEIAEDISDEVSAREDADTTLGGRIDDEETARENADTALGGRIDDEITARENADTALAGDISTLNKAVNFTTPELYGATGDGSTDDTTAIQAAMDSGKTVLFGSKTYKVTTLDLNSEMTLTGCAGTKISSSGVVFKAKNGIQYLHDVIISNMTIEGSTGIDLHARSYDNYAIEVSNVLFECSEYSINATKCFQWIVRNVQVKGTYGIVGMNGPCNTFENIYEMGCEYMFVNCDGLFININVSNSGTTQTVFDYTGTGYNHNLTVINSNFENVLGKVIDSVSTIGFTNVVFIGLNIRTPGSSDYLFVIYNPQNLFFEIRDMPIGLTKCFNIFGLNNVNSFYINKDVPVASQGYAVNTPYQLLTVDSFMTKTKFSCLDAKFITGCIAPVEETITAAYTIRASSGSYIKLTAGASTIAKVNPFNSAITGVNYFTPGTIITLYNSTDAAITLSSIADNYSFESEVTLAADETASFILQYNGSYYWHQI